MILGEATPRESFVRRDRDERARRAALKKAAPVVGPYQVGGTILCREPRAGEHGLRWCVRSRSIGFEKDKNSLGETQPRDSVFVCVAIDRPRPCTTAELLVFHFTQPKSSTPLATEAQTQRGFIEERASLAQPSRTVKTMKVKSQHKR